MIPHATLSVSISGENFVIGMPLGWATDFSTLTVHQTKNHNLSGELI